MGQHLRSFLTNTGFVRLLEESWRPDGFYAEPETGQPSPATISHYLLSYHLDLSLLGDKNPIHRERAEALAKHISGRVCENGFLLEPDGTVTDHPAGCSHVADTLGAFCHYGAKLGWDETAVKESREALIRIVEGHPSIRLPEGIVGRSQQMRFELRVYYWAWRATGESRYKDAFFKLWENGIHAYQNAIAHNGALLQPSLHPDWTWNYACGAGTTTSYATNTHTPTYYCTEPQGFAFVYAHGLKEGVLPENPVWSEFCRKYFLGLLRNLSRAGHTSNDVDGYGVHRAWYAGCLLETAPMEAAGLAMRLGLTREAGWYRWFLDRYVDYIQRSPAFAETGLIEQCPYGHRITIERQFPALAAARFYAHLARALQVYEVEKIEPVEPPALLHYAWWHNWARVSTPSYETSFVGTTSLCNLPVVKNFGDPNLGCIHGGAPLSTLFVGDRLMYVTSNDPGGLWHVELADVNGQVWRSCATSFADETSMIVKTSDGRLLSPDDFDDHEDPFVTQIEDAAAEVRWTKNIRQQGIRFYVANSYAPQSLSIRWGAAFPAGNYISRAVFILPFPAAMNPEIKIGGEWVPLTLDSQGKEWPEALRWSDGHATVEAGISKCPGRFSVAPVEIKERSPGGENSFCPFPLWQLRLDVAMTPKTNRVAVDTGLRFSQVGNR